MGKLIFWTLNNFLYRKIVKTNSKRYANNAKKLKENGFKVIKSMRNMHMLQLILSKQNIMSGKLKSFTTCPPW